MSKIVPIFSGGGTRLSAHIGILKALDVLNIEFKHIVGVSGGSIVSSLYCSGMPLEEIKQLALDTDFREFRGFSLIRLITQGGLCSGDKFEKWMDKLLNGATFDDIEKDLHILATDVNGGGPVIFNKTTSPKLKVSKAVRFSMSIPLFFSFQSYGSHILVDGAILSEDALYNDWAGDGTKIICFRLKSDQVSEPKFKKSWLPIKQYVMMLIRTFMTAMSREYVHDNHWQNTIVVNTGVLSPVDFNVSLEQKEQLFKVGYETALEFVPKRLSDHKRDKNVPNVSFSGS
ncbi:patatin-like phospholipase family protein [Paraglaciecola hydrolytica]|uniref:Phospholipase n=1 Tax=Paraglaciecola hydrolytica TaxID=1799789 RepID=A0A135ZZX9_9ALTE|nr:patatin-like phospholipase family protein [Paraglaciecola hydrolytica]KXI28522.1 phospholipase [Paraglaciecola hydrolytica]